MRARILLFVICLVPLRDVFPQDNAGQSIETATQTPQCELRIALPASIQSQAFLDSTNGPKAEAIIKNLSSVSVTLALPGDGSKYGRRTPIVGWSILPADSDEVHPKEPRIEDAELCGMPNGLKLNEIFVLNPGDSKSLNEWIGFPAAPPGKYRVMFYYSNVPEKKWVGALMQNERDAWPKLRSSTPITLRSNEVLMEIVK